MFNHLTDACAYLTQVISVFVLVGVIFVPIGLVSLKASRKVCCIFYSNFKICLAKREYHFLLTFFLCCRLLRLLIDTMMHVSQLIQLTSLLTSRTQQ